MKINQSERRKLRKRYQLKKRNYNNLPRFTIFRSNKNMYVQIIDDISGKTLVTYSSIEEEFKKNAQKGVTGYNISGAKKIGTEIAQRALKKNIKQVVFDIGAYKYHGKVKTIIENAIANGLQQTIEK